jgi:hypothetical protein
VRWWRAVDSPRGQLWFRAVLFVCGLVLAVGYFQDGKPVYGYLWVFFTLYYPFLTVSSWHALRAGSGEQDEVPTTP